MAAADTIFKALIKAKKDMGPLLKNAENGHFRNSYADINAVLDTIMEPLLKNGLTVFQRVEITENGLPVLKTTLAHESGETIDGGTYPLFTQNNTDPQKLASANTYARRYALTSFFGLGAEDDDGNAAAGHVASASTRKPSAKSGGGNKPSDAQIKFAQTLIQQVRGARTKAEADAVCKELANKPFDKLTGTDISKKIIEALQKEQAELNQVPF